MRSDSDELTVRPSQLKFTTSDWNTVQTVRVRAEHDDDAEDDPVVTLRYTASGGGYDGISENVRVTIDEDDDVTPIGARVHPKSLTIEEGGSTSYTLVLLAQPTGTVRVQVDVVGAPSEFDSSRIRVNPTLLTFTRDSWNAPQVITVSAPENAIDHKSVDVDLMHTMSGGGYEGQQPTVDVRIRDNDTADLVVTPTSLEIVQGSHQDYTVALASEPESNVTVGVSSDNDGVDPSPESLEFTPANWSSRKRVRVQAAPGAVGTSITLENSVSAGDAKYTGKSVDVAVTVRATNTAGVAVSPKAFTITEGETETYTVVLTKKPEENVTVKVTGAEDDISCESNNSEFHHQQLAHAKRGESHAESGRRCER